MRFRQLTAAVLVTVTLLSQNAFPVWAAEAGATRGEVAQMLLQAADDYNPNVQKTDIIKGYEDGQLHEERGVTRAEALVMLKRAFGTLPKPVGHNARMALASGDFHDIPDWAKDELSGVFDAGIAAGTAPGTFSPEDPVTQEQMQLFIDRVFALYGTNEKDDFYAAVNKEALETMEIPASRETESTFTALQSKTDAELLGAVKEAGTSSNSGKFFLSLLNKTFRDKQGLKPIEDSLAAIRNAKNFERLMQAHNTIQSKLYVPLLLGFTVNVDFKDSDNAYLTTLVTYEPLLPADFYENGTDEQKEAYFTYLRTVSAMAGQPFDEAGLEAFYAFEKDIASHRMTDIQAADIDATYNVLEKEELADLFPELTLGDFLAGSMLRKKSKYLVPDVELAKTLGSYMTKEHTELLRMVMQISLLRSFSAYLTTDLQDATLTLAAAYTGTPKLTEDELALELVKQWMPLDLGDQWLRSRYGLSSEPDEIKQNVTKLVTDILEEYRKQVDAIDWLSDTTKVRIRNKLSLLELRIGFPEERRDPWNYSRHFSVSEENGFFTVQRISEVYANAAMNAQNNNYRKEKDKSFALDFFSANAGYLAQNNRIEIPFALMQKPFYDENASYEENLAGIGFIIAHEIAHAFDPTGVRFDENGAFHTWMTEEETARFEEHCDELVDFYDGFEAAPGIAADGSLTLSENFADQLALQCITTLALQNKNVDMQKFYRDFARIWASTSTRGYAVYAGANDTHAPDKARVNRAVVNCPAFFEAFGITEKDGMWVDEEDRIRLW